VPRYWLATLWRIDQPGWRSPIALCLPTKTTEPPSGPLWLHEIKYDGFRVIARPGGVIWRAGCATATLLSDQVDIARDRPLTFPLLERVRTARKFIHTNPFSFRVFGPLGIVPFNAEFS
jgi:hypothetical protein